MKALREDIQANHRLTEKKRARLLEKLDECMARIKTQEQLVSYRYDALGRRVSKTEAKSKAKTYYVSSGQQVWSEFDLKKGNITPTIRTSFVYGSYIDDVVEIFDHTLAKPFYSHANHLYSVAAITNNKGKVVERKAYDAYGGVITLNNKGREIDASKSKSPFGFTGRRIDPETGLMYFRARYYSVELGRFVGRDPLGYVDGMSLYRGYFVVNGVDPRGESVRVVIDWVTRAANSPAGRWASQHADRAARAAAAAAAAAAWAATTRTGRDVLDWTRSTGSEARDWAEEQWNEWNEERAEDEANEGNESNDPCERSNRPYVPDRPLPRDEHGNPLPESDTEHTELGTRQGRNDNYPQAREFDRNGNPTRDIDFTDHGRNHPNPHQHRHLPNPTGGTPERGPAEPLP
ncbi:MAG: RHS repeat-associated core domain-containing protein [Desulfamplus sp.]|nr:RHS repeat-associated core domain-containing protein [Desulfamplus sp.]